MGLDTSHGCWHGSYSAFKRFRDAVAVAAETHRGYTPNYEAHPLRAFMGWWDHEHTSEDPGAHPWSDPLDVFFVHSDCDGWIFPHDAQQLADALEPLIGYMDEGDGVWTSNRQLLRQFVEGLRKAADEWQPVGFH